MNEIRSNEQKKENNSIFSKETFGVILILFSAICIVSLLTGESVFSKVGYFISSFLYGVFGYFSFLVFAILGYTGVLLLIGKKTGLPIKAKVLFSVSIILLATLLQIVLYDNSVEYKEYLSTIYSMGTSGISGSSVSGAIIALVSHPLSKLLTTVGSAVVVGICLLISAYFSFAVIKLNKGEVQGHKVRSTYVKEDKKDDGIKIDGTRDYPVSGLSFDDPKPKQVLFINEANDFSFKSKRDLTNGESGSVKISFTSSGLGVANYTTSKQDSLPEDYKKKIEYIKKPIDIDVEKTISKDYSNGFNINGTTSETKVSNYVNGKEKPIERRINDIPMVEHSIKPERQQSPTKNSAVENAQVFSNKYVDLPSAQNNDKVEYTKETENENIPNANEQQEREQSINSFDGEYIEEMPLNKQDVFGSDEEREDMHAEGDEYIADEYIEDKQDIQPKLQEAEETEEEIKEAFEEVENSENIDNQEVKPSRLSADKRIDSILGRVNDRDIKEANASNNNEIYNSNREEIIREEPEEDKPKMFGFGGSISGVKNDEPKVQQPIEEEIQEEKQERIIPKGFKYNRPPLDLLVSRPRRLDQDSENHEERLQIIKSTLEEFKINVEPQSYIQGPTVTRYEIKMPAGVSVNRVLQYDNDLRMRLESVAGVRIEAPIPGKNLVGIEVANKTRLKVGLKEIMEDCADKQSKPNALVFALGRDIVGEAKTDDIVKGLHFLVAGSTGSGKSVALNVMIMSLIMRYSPEELRFVLVDPKSVGFRIYEHLPHLLIDEIITDAQRTITVLTWLYDEMERRYQLFKNCEKVVSDLKGYNEYALSTNGEVEKLPRIIVVVDELADLMESCKKDMESRILALAQKARAAGIHLVLATQRPSVDIITGTIKANLPSRIGLRLTNSNDSQTILSCGGAEKLLGNGDMLYKNSEMNEPERYQGALISDEEILSICNYIRENNACYFNKELQSYLDKTDKTKNNEVSATEIPLEEGDGDEELLKRALWLGIQTGKVSISDLQRKFRLGFSRAGRLVDTMEELGYVSIGEGSKGRKVLISKEDFIARFGSVEDGSDF